jgi:uncharacterized protein (DUF1800 family)
VFQFRNGINSNLQNRSIGTPVEQDIQLETPSPKEEVKAPPPIKQVGEISVAMLMAASLAACGGGGDASAPPVAGTPPAPTTPPVAGTPPAGTPPAGTPPAGTPPAGTPPAPTGAAYPKALDANQAATFLQQAQFSSTQTEISSVRATTYADWLNQQYALPLSEKAYDWLTRRGYGVPDATFQFFNQTYPADAMLWKQLMAAPDQMRKRAALALSEFFVVSLNGSTFSWFSQANAQWWDMLCAQAFGNFRDLLEEVTLNPAMGNYLNVRGNKKEDGKGRLPDENYSREVMQLFTLGLYQLNVDGTEKRDAAGKPLESYSQSDVTNLARVFTGYRFDDTGSTNTTLTRSDNTTFNVRSAEFTTRRMSFLGTDHSTSEANFLGARVAGNLGGPESLKIALDTLFNHPNIGPFFGKQMIQRLVTSNPSPAYVRRVAESFNNNGNGVRGDLKAVWSAILLDDEARNPQTANSNSFGKLREPMVRIIQWARTFGAKSAADAWKIGDFSNNATRIGQSPLRSPSVFNFFRPGYVPPNTALAVTKTPAPEFQLVNETQVAGYLNYIQGLIRNGISVRRPDLPQNVSDAAEPLIVDFAANYATELLLVLDAQALVNHVNTVMCAGRITTANVALMVSALNATALTATSTDAQKLDRVAAAIYMAMACSDYLVQK